MKQYTYEIKYCYTNNKLEETKRKIGEAQKGNKNWLGKHHTEETKRKLSEANKGVKKPLRNKKEEKGYEKTVL